jgi:hypothetical protein
MDDELNVGESSESSVIDSFQWPTKDETVSKYVINLSVAQPLG